MTPSNRNDNPYAIAYGAKYDEKLDIAEIAKRVRADLKALGARALLARIEQVTAAYNYDGSDIASDYVHVNFYGHARFRWNGQEQREREALRAKYAPDPSSK